MAAEKIDVKLSVLLADGVLALALGLAVLYLWAIMANPFFELFGLVGVMLVSGGVFLLAAVVDLTAAWKIAVRALREGAVYLITAAVMTAVAASILFAWVDMILLMKILVIAHGLIFGTATLLAAMRGRTSGFVRVVEYCSGAASVAVAALVAGLARDISARSFVGWMGAYLCVVGVKLLSINGSLVYRRLHTVQDSPATTVRGERMDPLDAGRSRS